VTTPIASGFMVLVKYSNSLQGICFFSNIRNCSGTGGCKVKIFTLVDKSPVGTYLPPSSISKSIFTSLPDPCHLQVGYITTFSFGFLNSVA